MRKKLTKRAIDAAHYPDPKERPPRAHYLWDTEFSGFGLRVYPSGRKSFVATYRVRGKQRFLTLGRYGELTLHEARTKALEVLARARRGEDAASERTRYRRAPTVANLAERYIREHAIPTKKPKSLKNDDTSWRVHILPKLGRRKVADLSREDIEAFRPALADRPATFNSVRRLLSSALNLSEVWGWRPEGSNPCRHVKPFKDKPRVSCSLQDQVHP